MSAAVPNTVFSFGAPATSCARSTPHMILLNSSYLLNTSPRLRGQAGVPYPSDPAALSDEEWARFLFFRDNPRGPFRERWVHTHGCRRWFELTRDTLTHEIHVQRR